MSDTTPVRTLPDYLRSEALDQELAALIMAVGAACIDIGARVAAGALGGVLGSAGSGNVQGEDQKKLDVIANDILIAAAAESGAAAAIASEEEEDILVFPERETRGHWLLLFDPLDGSSNIDVNVSIGTIFSILPAPVGAVTRSDFLQCGRRQAAAGYAVYGPQTMFVLTIRAGVAAFTLDPSTNQWVRTASDIAIPRASNEFAINMSNQRHWADPVKTYIAECQAGREGPRGKDFNMRWIASMVADVHRILNRGGVFLYPWDKREPERAGKLRLMYEANPLGLVVERAGGAATNAMDAILDIEPATLHQRVAVVLGSADEVERITKAHSPA